MKTVAYYRNSINTQDNSIHTQQYKVQKKSIEYVIPIDEEFIDKDVSARKVPLNKRPKLNELLKEIEADRVSTLFVYKRDRLARNVLDYLKIYRLLKQKEIKVIFAADNEPPMQYSAIGELFETMMAGINQQEGDRIVERAKATWDANFMNGTAPGNLPYGYKYDKEKDKIEKVAEELNNVQQLFNELITGKYKMIKEFTTALVEKGFTKSGQQWNSDTVRSIVTNPTYSGLRIRKTDQKPLKKLYEDLAVITKEEWDKANEILEIIAPTKTNKPNYDRSKTVFLLENLITCSHCGNNLIPNNARKMENLKYECKSCENNTPFVFKEEAEVKVFQAAINFFKQLKTKNFQGLYQIYKNNCLNEFHKKLEILESELGKIERQISNKAELWLQEQHVEDVEKLKVNLMNLYDKLLYKKNLHEQLLKEIQELKVSSIKLSSFQEDLESKKVFLQLNDEIKKELLNDITHSIVVSPFSIKITFKHPFFEVKEVLEDDTK